jgi:tetratricopeptide (TPR) repeat protein
MRRIALGGLAVVVVLTGCAQWQPFEDRRREARDRFDQHKARFKYALALEQFEHGQIDQAYKSIQETLALHADEPAYQLLLAKVQLERGELAAALATLQHVAYQGQPVAERHYVCGLLAERYGRTEEALLHFEEARKLDPLNRDTLMACAETLVHLGRADQALQLIESEVHHFDGHWSLHALRGEILQLEGRHVEAADAFAAAVVQNDSDPQLTLARGLALHDARRHGEAVAVLGEVARRLQGAAPVHALRALGASSLEAGQPAEAREHLREVTRQAPRDWLAWLLLARCELALGSPVAAQRAAQQAVEVGGDRPEALTLLGFLHLRLGEQDQAGQVLRRALNLDPRNAVAYCLLGRIAELGGATREAEDYYGLALQIDPEDGLARSLLAALQTEAGQNEPRRPGPAERTTTGPGAAGILPGTEKENP